MYMVVKILDDVILRHDYQGVEPGVIRSYGSNTYNVHGSYGSTIRYCLLHLIVEAEALRKNIG